MRSFVQFDGEGETANARERDIGGHAAVLLRQIRYRWMPNSPYANENGCVPVGTLEDYASGRSNGCTSWSRSDAEQIIPLLKDPTTLYIYPESEDIKAVAQAVSARRPHSSDRPYWNAVCLKQIGAPKFWSRESLGPLLAKFRSDPEPAPRRRGGLQAGELGRQSNKRIALHCSPIAPALRLHSPFAQALLFVASERGQQIADDPAGSGLDFDGYGHAGRKIDALVLDLHLAAVD